MNKIIITGRLTRDPETKQTQSDLTVVRFSVAVDRRIKKDGEATADFFNCTAFGKQAEFVQKYFSKGMKIDLTGHVQTGSYTNKEGQKVNTFDILVDDCEFGERKSLNENAQASAPPPIAPAPAPAPQAPPMYNGVPPVQQNAMPPQYQQQSMPQQQYVPQPQYQQQPQQPYYPQQPAQNQQPLPDFMNIPPNSPDEIPFP